MTVGFSSKNDLIESVRILEFFNVSQHGIPFFSLFEYPLYLSILEFQGKESLIPELYHTNTNSKFFFAALFVKYQDFHAYICFEILANFPLLLWNFRFFPRGKTNVLYMGGRSFF